MARRKRHDAFEFYVVRVDQAATYVGSSRGDPRGRGRRGMSSIEITGDLDKAVIRRRRAHVSVYVEDEVVQGPGHAMGTSGDSWSVTVWLPREQFRDLFAIVLAGKLLWIQLAVEALRRGKGAILSAGFHTEDEPEEDEG